MADITKCSGEGCKIKETCYRFTAKSKPYRQSFFKSPPCDKGGKVCQKYWDNGYKNI